jgi:hypothetical protein
LKHDKQNLSVRQPTTCRKKRKKERKKERKKKRNDLKEMKETYFKKEETYLMKKKTEKKKSFSLAKQYIYSNSKSLTILLKIIYGQRDINQN